jgi:hypothetical protein
MNEELKSHILNLYHLALSDHEFDKAEREMLYDTGKRWGLSSNEIDEVISNPHLGTFTIPADPTKRMLFIKEYVEMILADGIIKENEESVLKKLLSQFGLSGYFSFDAKPGSAGNKEPAINEEDVSKKLIPIFIKKKKKIFLENPNGKEIPLTPLHKSIYVFYLMHPEGVRLKELSNHKTELLHLYRKMSVSDDESKTVSSINSLVDAYGNSFNEKKARINNIINGILGNSISPYYRIVGRPGHPFKVDLPGSYINFID